MYKICIVCKPIEKIRKLNYMYFSNALNTRGDEVWIADINTLTLNGKNRVIAKAEKVNFELIEGEFFSNNDNGYTNLDKFDYIWILSLLERNILLDKIEILNSIRKKKIINSINTLLFFGSKVNSTLFSGVNYPESYISSDPNYLLQIISESEKEWMIKPISGYSGKNVFYLNPKDINKLTIINSLTDNKNSERYCVLQEFVHETSEFNEIRVLLANGKIVGQYEKPSERYNRIDFQEHELSDEERNMCQSIGKKLFKFGASYVGIDMIFPYILEINVLNPGGLSIIERITGIDVSCNIINQLFPLKKKR